MTYSEEFSEKVHACRELYLKHDGENHELIEQEMRDLGYHDFHRRVLYRRFERGTYTPSWVERFGWTQALRDQRDRLKKAAATSSGSPPYEGGVDAGSGQKDWPVRNAVGGRGGSLVSDSLQAGAPAYPQPVPPDQLPEFPEFKAWLERTWPTGRNWDWKHLNYIYKHLKRVWDGDCKRLMIFMPPRHGKSELVTVRFPAWTLKHRPETKIIVGCYTQPLANRFSRMIRSALADDAFITQMQKCGEEKENLPRMNADSADRSQFKETFIGPGSDPHDPRSSAAKDLPLRPGRPAVDPSLWPARVRSKNSESEWETSQGGGVRAVGAGASITGYGAHLIVIDDPVKSRAEAESETCRDRVWNWFNDDVYTASSPTARSSSSKPAGTKTTSPAAC